MPSPDVSSDEMLVETSRTSSFSTSPNRLSLPHVTIKDSLEAITDLITELQANDAEVVHPPSSIQVTTPRPHVQNMSTTSQDTMQFSLSAAARSTGHKATLLPHAKQFLHCLLCIPSTTILPIRNDNLASPLKTTSQVNELSSIGLKSFFRPNKASQNNLTGDFHIQMSLSFDDFKQHPKFSNWLFEWPQCCSM